MRYYDRSELKGLDGKYHTMPDVPGIYGSPDGVYVYIDEIMHETRIPKPLALWVKGMVEGNYVKTDYLVDLADFEQIDTAFSDKLTDTDLLARCQCVSMGGGWGHIAELMKRFKGRVEEEEKGKLWDKVLFEAVSMRPFHAYASGVDCEAAFYDWWELHPTQGV